VTNPATDCEGGAKRSCISTAEYSHHPRDPRHLQHPRKLFDIVVFATLSLLNHLLHVLVLAHQGASTASTSDQGREIFSSTNTPLSSVADAIRVHENLERHQLRPDNHPLSSWIKPNHALGATTRCTRQDLDLAHRLFHISHPHLASSINQIKRRLEIGMDADAETRHDTTQAIEH
jgi:hypothetical protein